MFKFICSECGSEDVSSKCWANPNNDEVFDYVGEEANDNWCNVCQEHVHIKTEEVVKIEITEEQRKLLLEAIQFVGFALTENMPEELLTITVLEKALTKQDFSGLEALASGDSIKFCEDCLEPLKTINFEVGEEINTESKCANKDCGAYVEEGYGLN